MYTVRIEYVLCAIEVASGDSDNDVTDWCSLHPASYALIKLLNLDYQFPFPHSSGGFRAYSGVVLADQDLQFTEGHVSDHVLGQMWQDLKNTFVRYTPFTVDIGSMT